MKILQEKVSEIKQSAFFYHGVIATGKGYKLETHQGGEIMYDSGLTQKTYVGAETPKLAETDCTDADINMELIVDIYVDKFFAITSDGAVMDEGELYFDMYDDAIKEFENFLSKV